MSSEKKKLPAILKTTIVLAATAVLLLIVSIVTSVYSVNRTVKAIDSIGEVEYTQESKEKIDLAQSYYVALDTNIGLDKKIENAEQLTAAKREYVRLGIRRAYVANLSGEAEETVKQYVEEARKNFDEYCSTGECTSISNYQDLIDLEAKYISGSQNSDNNTSPSTPSEGETPELC